MTGLTGSTTAVEDQAIMITGVMVNENTNGCSYNLHLVLSDMRNDWLQASQGFGSNVL